jgi:hypothetical protein
MTLELIDKQDSFEIVRDQIGAILVTEIASQIALATAALKPNPDDWKLRVFTERANPWEQFLQAPVADPSPLVNVWYESSSFDAKASNTFERQKASGTFNIDCYGYGVSADDGATGHTPGDAAAALEVQKALRLCRNILMAAEYTYLGLRGLVWQRWPQAVTVFQPQLDGQTVQNIVGARLALQVQFNEFSPQVAPEDLEFISIDVFRAEDGELVLEADYDYTV